MQDINPPSEPVPVASMVQRDQVEVLLQDYADAMQWGATVEASRQSLIDYIHRVKEWYERSH